MTNWRVYVLASDDGRRTYVGATVDPKRRLRQHNGELSGGARATRGRRWRMVRLVGDFGGDQSAALSFEWWVKRVSRRRSGRPLERRDAAIRELMGRARWRPRGLVVAAGPDLESGSLIVAPDLEEGLGPREPAVPEQQLSGDGLDRVSGDEA